MWTHLSRISHHATLNPRLHPSSLPNRSTNSTISTRSVAIQRSIGSRSSPMSTHGPLYGSPCSPRYPLLCSISSMHSSHSPAFRLALAGIGLKRHSFHTLHGQGSRIGQISWPLPMVRPLRSLRHPPGAPADSNGGVFLSRSQPPLSHSRTMLAQSGRSTIAHRLS